MLAADQPLAGRDLGDQRGRPLARGRLTGATGPVRVYSRPPRRNCVCRRNSLSPASVRVTATVRAAATVRAVAASPSPPATGPGDADAMVGQVRMVTARRASAAARRPNPLVQGRSAVATSRIVLISVGISTTVRGPCARRTQERYPESWPCLLFGGTTGRCGRDGNYVVFVGGHLGTLPGSQSRYLLLRMDRHAYHVHGLEALRALLNLTSARGPRCQVGQGLFRAPRP